MTCSIFLAEGPGKATTGFSVCIPTPDGNREEAARGERERKRQRGTEADTGERVFRDPDAGRKEKRGGTPRRERAHKSQQATLMCPPRGTTDLKETQTDRT